MPDCAIMPNSQMIGETETETYTYIHVARLCTLRVFASVYVFACKVLLIRLSTTHMAEHCGTETEGAALRHPEATTVLAGTLPADHTECAFEKASTEGVSIIDRNEVVGACCCRFDRCSPVST